MPKKIYLPSCVQRYEEKYKGYILQATYDIPRHANIGQHVGEMKKNTITQGKERYCADLGSGFMSDAEHMGNLTCYINCSYNPNCMIIILLVNGNRQLWIQTLASIKVGDGLTIDYQWGKYFECNYGEKCCKYIN